MLYALCARSAAAVAPSLGVEAVALRDLVAVVRRVPWGRVEATSDAILEFRRVVEGAFADRSLVPAPFGTVFRSRDALVKWMELHYVALLDGVAFVEGKATARVRLMADGNAPTAEFEAVVFDSMRALSRHASASRTNVERGDHGVRSAEGSFLVDRGAWGDFTNAVTDEQARAEGVTLESTGPWPPYDFVSLQFGG